MSRHGLLTVELSRSALRPCFQPDERPALLDELKAVRMLMRLRGERLPGLLIRDNLTLPTGVYRILLANREVGRGVLPTDRLHAVGSLEAVAQLRGEPKLDAPLGLPGMWIQREERRRAERLGCLIRTPAIVVANHVGLIAREHAAELRKNWSLWGRIQGHGRWAGDFACSLSAHLYLPHIPYRRPAKFPLRNKGG